MLSKGLVVIRVEYVVVEVVSPSNLRSHPANSDGVGSRPLFKHMQVPTAAWRSCNRLSKLFLKSWHNNIMFHLFSRFHQTGGEGGQILT